MAFEVLEDQVDGFAQVLGRTALRATLFERGLIYDRLKAIGQLGRLERIVPPKDWRPAWGAGARKLVRPEHRV